MRVSLSLSLIAAVLLVGGAALGQDAAELPEQGAGEIDPSDPSNFYSVVEFNGEWQHHTSGNVVGARIMPTYQFSGGKQLLQAEIPIMGAKLDGQEKAAAGVGDIRLRYFGLPRKDDSKLLSVFGASIDVIMPTGNSEKNLGSGRWILSPGVGFGFNPTESGVLKVFPIFSYMYFSKEEGVASHGLRAETIAVITLPKNMWLQIWPEYGRIAKGNHAAWFSTRFLFGKMLTERTAMTVEYLREFINDVGLEYHLRVGYSVYF